jgi:pilus assembly protein CpaE
MNLLLAGVDAKLREEIEAALVGLDSPPVVHHASDLRQAIEMARSRRPQLTLVEMTTDLRALKTFAEELAVVSPDTAIGAVFRPEIFGHDVSESAILIEALRAGVRDFLRRPISSRDLQQLLERAAGQRLSDARSLGKVITVISNKGGVGKSTLSVNTACGLAVRHPERVLLIDLSLQIGVCASLLDLRPTHTLTDAARQRDRLDETLLRQLATVHPSGLHLLAAPSTAVEGAEIDDEIIAHVLTLARRAYDFVIVDTFPLLDRVVMAALDVSDRIYIALENVVPTLVSGAKLVELLDGMGYDRSRQRIVLNRYLRAGGNLKAADVAQQLGRDVDHVVPYHHKVIQAANTGRPFVLTTGRFSSLGRSIRGLVSDVDRMLVAGGPSSPASVGARPS